MSANKMSVPLPVQSTAGLNSSPSSQFSPLRRRTRLTCESTTRALSPEINRVTSARQLRRSEKVSCASINVTPSNVRRRHRQPTVPVSWAHNPERRYTSTYIQAPQETISTQSYCQIRVKQQAAEAKAGQQLNRLRTAVRATAKGHR